MAGNIKATSLEQLLMLKYDIQNKVLKEWALKYGVLDLVMIMCSFKELYLGNTFIDNKFRSSLSTNDKMIINAVYEFIIN